VKRTGFATPTIEQIRAAQARQQAQRLTSKQRRDQLRAGPHPHSKRTRRNDGPWRTAVVTKRGSRCRACGSTRHVEVDHIIPKGRGGPRAEVRNGLPLCGDYGPCRAHPLKTAEKLKIELAWLDPDQVEWLAEQGHVSWLPDGSVTGRHCKLFAPTKGNPA
jgi:hypothetical protein